jgi:hypothetical protein
MPDFVAGGGTLSIVADPAVVLVVLLAADAADPATQAVLPAVRRPLGEDAVVLVQQSETQRTDDEALALARQVHALSVVTLTWEDPAHSHVRLHLLLVEGPRRYDYNLAFEPGDQPGERGRAIGLAMTPVLTRAIAAAHSPGDASLTGPSQEQESVANDTALPASLGRGAAANPPPTALAGDRATPPSSAVRRGAFLAADVGSSASVGIGGNALGVGPTVGVRASVLGPLGLHVIGLARFGSVDALSATSATFGFGGGATWRVLRFGADPHALEVGGRVDVLATQIALSEDIGGTTVRRSRWLTAVDLLAEAAWPLGSHFELTGAVGGEIAAGTTAITVGGLPVDHIPVGRGVAELGVRIPF